jgi:hypothetical protein
LQGIAQLHPNGTVYFYHRNPGKYKLGQQLLPAATHITARASAPHAESLLPEYTLN